MIWIKITLFQNILYLSFYQNFSLFFFFFHRHNINNIDIQKRQNIKTDKMEKLNYPEVRRDEEKFDDFHGNQIGLSLIHI